MININKIIKKFPLFFPHIKLTKKIIKKNSRTPLGEVSDFIQGAEPVESGQERGV